MPEMSGNSDEFVDPVLWNVTRCESQAVLNQHVQYLKTKNIATQVEIMESPSVERLFQHIADSNCDLIVTDISKDKESWLIESLIKHTQVPIYVVHQEDTRAEYNHILVALDGSQRAESSLNLAAAFANQTGAQLHLGHVVQQPEIPRKTQMAAEDLEMARHLTERYTEEANNYLNQLASRLVSEIKTHINVSEKPLTSLHNLIKEQHIDLLILSAHGYSGNPEWPLGTVAENLVRYSEVPTLIVQDLPTQIDVAQPDPGRTSHQEARA
jgi:nucleotide-binding universal stress UspA family protein